MKPLTLRKQKFVDAMLVKPNATEAAKAAGYAPKTAMSAGSRLLKDPEVQAALASRTEKAAELAEFGAAEVLRELARIFRSDIAHAFKEDGSLKAIHEIPEDTRRAIASVEINELFEGSGKDKAQIGWAKKVKFWSKDSAIEKAMKHLGLLADHLRLSDKDGQPLTINIVRKVRA